MLSLQWPVLLRSRKEMTLGLCLLLLGSQLAGANIPTYYMDEYCSTTLDMTRTRVPSGRLLLRRPEVGLRFRNCFMFIKAPSNKRLTFKFHSFDIQSPHGCYNNHIQIFDDIERQISLTDQLCNSNQVPNKAYVTSGEDSAIWLMKEHYLADQIELVFTAFSFSPCVGGDYLCDNAHCISSTLYCNGYDNCGDESDICLLRQETVLGIIIAAVIVVVILAILLALYMYRRQHRIRREREKEFLSELAFASSFEDNKGFNDHDLDKHSGVSDISSIYSSTIRKQPSLLSRRDHQMKMLGYQNTRGSRASTLERRPYVHPYDSEMATKVHYIVHEGHGVSRRSTLERKIDRAHHHKDSSTLDRKTRSMDLRAPFYFDRDGYYSDGTHVSPHEDIYASLKKLHGKKVTVSRQNSSATYPGRAVELQEETDTKKKKKKKLKKKSKKKKSEKEESVDDMHDGGHGDQAPVEGYESGLKEMQVKDKEMYEPHPLEPLSPEIYINPPQDMFAKHLLAPGPDIVLVSKDAHSGQALIGHDYTNSDYNTSTINIKNSKNKNSTTTTNHNNHTNSNNSNHNNSGHTTTDRNKINDNKADSAIKHTSGTEAMTNLDLEPKVGERSEGMTLHVPPNPGYTSLARQRALQARHEDGSPFSLHTVDAHEVDKQLKDHPETGADVFDHVISFRAYPSPVPARDERCYRSLSRKSSGDT